MFVVEAKLGRRWRSAIPSGQQIASRDRMHRLSSRSERPENPPDLRAWQWRTIAVNALASPGTGVAGLRVPRSGIRYREHDCSQWRQGRHPAVVALHPPRRRRQGYRSTHRACCRNEGSCASRHPGLPDRRLPLSGRGRGRGGCPLEDIDLWGRATNDGPCAAHGPDAGVATQFRVLQGPPWRKFSVGPRHSRLPGQRHGR